MREVTNLTAMIGAFAGASITHLGPPMVENAIWLGCTAFASASIALYARAVIDKRKARQHDQDQTPNCSLLDRTGDAARSPWWTR